MDEGSAFTYCQLHKDAHAAACPCDAQFLDGVRSPLRPLFATDGPSALHTTMLQVLSTPNLAFGGLLAATRSELYTLVPSRPAQSPLHSTGRSRHTPPRAHEAAAAPI